MVLFIACVGVTSITITTTITNIMITMIMRGSCGLALPSTPPHPNCSVYLVLAVKRFRNSMHTTARAYEHPRTSHVAFFGTQICLPSCAPWLRQPCEVPGLRSIDHSLAGGGGGNQVPLSGTRTWLID